MTGLWLAAFVALWALVVLLGLLVLGTLRRLTPLIERTEASLRAAATASLGGLPSGAAVPPFTAKDIGGRQFSEADLKGSTTVVLFLGSTCRACKRFVEGLTAGRVPELDVQLVVVADSREFAIELARSQAVVILDEDRAFARTFDSDLVPQAFVVDEHGTVRASGRPNDWDGLRSVLATAKGGDREHETTEAVVASM